MSDEEEMGYAAALAELDGILRELDSEQLDIDVLADRVERAAQLIELCRERITRAQLRVDQIVAGMQP